MGCIYQVVSYTEWYNKPAIKLKSLKIPKNKLPLCSESIYTNLHEETNLMLC